MKVRTENAILQEKLSQTRYEADDLKLRFTNEVTEKLRELEASNKVLREEMKKKDSSLVELTNEGIRI